MCSSPGVPLSISDQWDERQIGHETADFWSAPIGEGPLLYEIILSHARHLGDTRKRRKAGKGSALPSVPLLVLAEFFLNSRQGARTIGDDGIGTLKEGGQFQFGGALQKAAEART
jgi:hypothetical protein